MPKMRALTIVVLGLAASIAACSKAHEASRAAGRPPARVAVEQVAVQRVPDTVEAVGTVRSWKQTALSSRVVATVRAVSVREGDHVRAGQTLVELDDRDVLVQLRRAEAALAEAGSVRDEIERAIAGAERAVDAATAHEQFAAATHRRYEVLVERGLIAAQDYEDTTARYRVASAEAARAHETKASLIARQRQTVTAIARAEADLDNARITVGYTRITAPADGVVVARAVEIGNLAAPGVVLITLDEERYRLEATVQESDLRHVRLGQTALVTVDALGLSAQSPVVEIVPASDPTSCTFVVKLALPAHARVTSGLYGRAAFTIGERTITAVPASAVLDRGQLEAVFVVDSDDVAHLRLVKRGRRVGDRVEILSGVAAGERVVIDGAARLTDGQRIERAS